MGGVDLHSALFRDDSLIAEAVASYDDIRDARATSSPKPER